MSILQRFQFCALRRCQTALTESQSMKSRGLPEYETLSNHHHARPCFEACLLFCKPTTICRLMKQLGLKIEYGTKYNYSLRENRPYYVNRLHREFRPEAPNRAWVSDITMVRVGTSILFLCVIMDLYARKIISYTIADNMHTNIVSEALIKAYLSRGCPEGLMFHSDQGTQYTAYTVKQMMRGEGIALSYSNAGCPYDNAVGESFFSSLKKEHIYCYEFQDEWEFKVSIQEYIEFYNSYRPHSTIGYLTPNEAEEAYFAPQ